MYRRQPRNFAGTVRSSVAELGLISAFGLESDVANRTSLRLHAQRSCGAAQRGEAVADRIVGNRVRREVLAQIDELLSHKTTLRGENDFWLLAARAEALLGLVDAEADEAVNALEIAAGGGWQIQSLRNQLNHLKPLLMRWNPEHR